MGEGRSVIYGVRGGRATIWISKTLWGAICFVKTPKAFRDFVDEITTAVALSESPKAIEIA